MSDPRYPVGTFQRRDVLTPEERAQCIEQIAAVPQAMRDAVAGLTPEQLETPYRDGGWTLRQVVHHVPESHMNSYMRFKFALTEETPTVKPYDEARWAQTPEVRDTPIETSLALLEALHDRWVRLLRAMSADDFARTLKHPEHDGTMTLDTMLGLYAWHGRHHTAHITTTRERNGW
jgi:uncharacterized damage-inducible protein DinB